MSEITANWKTQAVETANALRAERERNQLQREIENRASDFANAREGFEKIGLPVPAVLEISDGIGTATLDGTRFRFWVSLRAYRYPGNPASVAMLGECPVCGREITSETLQDLEDVGNQLLAFTPRAHHCGQAVDEFGEPVLPQVPSVPEYDPLTELRNLLRGILQLDGEA